MKEILLNTVHKGRANYKKYFALIDDEDFERVNQHNWCTRKRGNTTYATTKINGKATQMHAFITGFEMSDHINGNGLDNQRSNLRECTYQQNAMNQKPQKGGTSQYKGVSWDSRDKKWRAGIMLSGRQTHLGYFLYEHNAALAYNFAAIKHFGEYALVNKLKEKGTQ